MHYDGPSVTIEDEVNRQTAVRQHSRSSIWSLLVIERAVIKSFGEEQNLVKVEFDDGSQYLMRLKTPLEQILFFLGDTELLNDIPCIAYYRSTPLDGFVELGEIFHEEEKDDARYVYEPFFL